MTVDPLSWSPHGVGKGEHILRLHAEEMFAEAERIARRSDADTVSAAHVDMAAKHLRLGRRSTLFADVATNGGLTLLGLAGGTLISIGVATEPMGTIGWWALGLAVVSALFAGAGFAARAIAR